MEYIRLEILNCVMQRSANIGIGNQELFVIR